MAHEVVLRAAIAFVGGSLAICETLRSNRRHEREELVVVAGSCQSGQDQLDCTFCLQAAVLGEVAGLQGLGNVECELCARKSCD